MKIVSNFKDYYDSGATWMRSDYPFYLRKTKNIKKERILNLNPLVLNSRDNWFISPNGAYEHDINFFLVGFCGKFQIGYRLEDHCYYNSDDVIKAYEEYNNKAHWTTYSEKDYYPKYIKHVFNKNLTSCNDLFIGLDCPVFMFNFDKLGNTRTLTTNPNLKEIEFFRVFEPLIAYQEIDMYLGNILVKDQSLDMSKISNDDMAKAKGFGHKYDFRKEPKEKK